MTAYTDMEVWFVTGSQTLYGDETLRQVAKDAAVVAQALNDSKTVSIRVVHTDTVKSSDEIAAVCRDANNSPNCIGLITWMHTFSPAKMWISGLTSLNKPFMHLHTQFNAELPWKSINMDFMNLNQSAHGGREFGYIGARLRLERKVVVGHWKDDRVQRDIDGWVRSAKAWHASRNLKVARFGDNMREVAVTEGDKVSAQIQFGFEVHGYGLGDLADVVNDVSDQDVAAIMEEYDASYVMSDALRADAAQMECVRNDARLEVGIKRFLDAGNFGAFTNTFENLHGISNLPGLATQRLMAQGYGYGGEGDWKTAAFTHIFKVMADGRKGGTSFMEDYTYHFSSRDQVLGAHMLEICPSITTDKPSLDVHLHTIGQTRDIARLVFTGAPGPAINVACIDLGNRFRLILNEVDGVTPPEDLPNLPVARTLWEPKPSLSVSAAAWILAGGAHHTVYSQALTTENIADFADIAGVELVVIDSNTSIREFKNELRYGAVYHHLAQGV
jgi:L-arabinose isomerase